MVDFDLHVRRGHPIVFSIIIVFGIIEIAISGWLVGQYNSHHNFPSNSVRDRSRFLLFTSSWTVFFSLFYVALFQHFLSDGSILTSLLSHAVFLFITWVFWLAGAASITSSLGGRLNCSHDHVPYCGQLNALEAFAWIEWAFITLTLVVVFLRAVSATRRGDGLRGQLIP
ncbi:hypothetical protein AcW1_001316 [Taiwanofungus camphoratus]|nr:hypothetical protein AcW2_000157 [Antrodia cinnamomea]KAI0937297.1 hypothetical protein AcV5_005238 [Antrodia cinnamomea]KAI0962507.1 hypothetical protein AcV7_001339 [Antrodia cinnamomea]KAI0964511.1 hypothetical protein AcW1_001316 [Antrodia cinnamomea]